MSAGLILRAALAYGTSENDWPMRPPYEQSPPAQRPIVLKIVTVVVAAVGVGVLLKGGSERVPRFWDS